MCSKIRIACVLKSGGEYEPDHVYLLQKQIEKHVTVPYEFVCFSDHKDLKCETIKLTQNLSGWWSQLELFRPDVQTGERTFYLDLDVVVIGNIDHMVSYENDFIIAEEYRHLDVPTSTLMSFNKMGANHVWEAWLRVFKKINLDRKSPLSTVFFQPYTKHVFLQRLFPNQICSYRKDWARGAANLDTRIICFHGQPKPWNVDPISSIKDMPEK